MSRLIAIKMPPKRKIVIAPEQKQMLPDYKEDDLTLTQAQFIFASVIEWYKSKGEDVPEDDIKWCKEYIRQELEEKNKPVEEEPTVAEKPSFGSGDYWAKKKAAGYVTKKDAALAALKAKNQ
jgi:hypothetical protein